MSTSMDLREIIIWDEILNGGYHFAHITAAKNTGSPMNTTRGYRSNHICGNFFLADMTKAQPSPTAPCIKYVAPLTYNPDAHMHFPLPVNFRPGIASTDHVIKCDYQLEHH